MIGVTLRVYRNSAPIRISPSRSTGSVLLFVTEDKASEKDASLHTRITGDLIDT